MQPLAALAKVAGEQQVWSRAGRYVMMFDLLLPWPSQLGRAGSVGRQGRKRMQPLAPLAKFAGEQQVWSRAGRFFMMFDLQLPFWPSHLGGAGSVGRQGRKRMQPLAPLAKVAGEQRILGTIGVLDF
jgi:hypothetical protein